MNAPLTVSWSEYEYYDIEHDMDVVRMMAVTGTGTWFTDIECAARGMASARKRFQQLVLQKMVTPAEPGWLDMSEEVEMH